MKIFSYLRVSSQGQIDGDGFERQKEAVGKFCQAHGLIHSGTFRESISGTSDATERKEFSEMLAYIDTRADSVDKVDAVVVERMDRLARDLMVSEVLLKELRSRGVKVFSADQGTLIDMASDGGDPTRVLIRQMMGALAQWEKSQLVKKLKAARDRKKASGQHCEGNKPYGTYPGEKQVMELIKNVFTEEFGDLAIAGLLNDGGFKTRRGKPWTRQAVRTIRKGVIKQ